MSNLTFSAAAFAARVAGAPPPTDDFTDETNESKDSFVDSITDAAPRVLAAIAVVVVAYGLSRLLRMLLHRALQKNHTPSFARVMSKLGGWILLGVAILVAVTVVFPSVKPVDLLAGLGFFSVAVGFAFQDILENTLAGILLLFRQPFESGDQIEVEGQIGTVEGITIRETQLKAFTGERIIIPNRDVYKSAIVVATHYEKRRQEFVVGIAYENDATEATDAIATALASVDGVLSDPAPEAFVKELGVSTVDIAALFWADSRRFDGRRVRDQAIIAVKRALDEAGIEMPADIVALQATPSFKAALQGEGELTPAGSIAASSN